MNNQIRRVYIKEMGKYGEVYWHECLFAEIKKDNIFRLQEPNGRYVEYEGNAEFIALDDVYINPDGIGEVSMWT